MKKYTIKDWAIALFNTTNGLQGEKRAEAVAGFAKLLHKQGMLKNTEQVIKEFLKYCKKQSGIIELEVTSAHQLGNNSLKKISDAFGGKTEIKEKINPDILGGIVIKTDDKILDGSLKKQIELLKQRIS